MKDELELELLLSFDGASYQASEGYVVEFTVKRTDMTAQRPHGINYALVFRPANGEPFVRFDNAHVSNRPGGKYVKTPAAYDQRGEEEPGTFWFDVDRPADTPLPDPQRVSKAASMAIRSLEEMARTKSLARKVGRICIDICLYKCLYFKACGGSWNLRVLIGIVATGRNARNTDSRVPRLRVCLTGRS
jgi:hypothetical protein